ncbi:M20 metallopeptidase family protein [Arthrobacter burdickii]|uniref:M20 family metallopeptidase n=1 Tax=Arthrobacter burdickii TaxID=3035920 RepID=A0ABT8K0P4_9MICC|nr:M20 family metallopeptidase [Arthrobacter burdickii]MDN4610396.1 M20 family metallopeptidase [Arthrobacter burdickii]
MTLSPAALLEDARSLTGDIIDLRHRLHREPELGLYLPRTQEKVLAALDGLPYEVTLGTDTTSVTAVLRGGASGADGAAPVVLLRGDMDALPVQETTGVPYSSEVDGVMHACGHDLHTAMLAGAATLLAERRGELPGDVVLMFQPGEEGHDGAGVMIREGVLGAAGRTPDAAYGLHVTSSLMPNGMLTSRGGPLMSASDALMVTVRGAGGHGSSPHSAKDPVTVAAEIVTQLQVLITRQFNMFDPVVLSVGVLKAGTQRNIIPETARIEATIRTFSTANRDRMTEAAPRLVRHIAAAHGLEAEIEYLHEYPVTITDLDETAHAEAQVAELLGAERYVTMPQPMSGSEDFSRILDAVPGSFVFLSAVPPGVEPVTAPFNHSPYAVFDDSVLADGAALYAQLAISRLLSADARREAAGG